MSALDESELTCPQPLLPVVLNSLPKKKEKKSLKMCPTDQSASNGTQDKSQMVPVGQSTRAVNGSNGHQVPSAPTQQQKNPYAPRYADFLSNISNFKIIESTLRGRPPTGSSHFACDLTLAGLNNEQRESSLPTLSLILRPRLPSPRPSMRLASSTSSSPPPPHQSSPGWIVKPSASLD